MPVHIYILEFCVDFFTLIFFYSVFLCLSVSMHTHEHNECVPVHAYIHILFQGYWVGLMCVRMYLVPHIDVF